jgi:hypothetical protein
LVTVIRTRLDEGTVAVVRSTADDLDIAVDERHITAAAARAIALGLNGVAGTCTGPRKAPEGFPGTQRAS